MLGRIPLLFTTIWGLVAINCLDIYSTWHNYIHFHSSNNHWTEVDHCFLCHWEVFHWRIEQWGRAYKHYSNGCTDTSLNNHLDRLKIANIIVWKQIKTSVKSNSCFVWYEILHNEEESDLFRKTKKANCRPLCRGFWTGHCMTPTQSMHYQAWFPPGKRRDICIKVWLFDSSPPKVTFSQNGGGILKKKNSKNSPSPSLPGEYLLRFGVWSVCCWGPVIPPQVWCLEA